MNGCNGGGVCKCVLCNLNYKIREDLSTENLECLVLEFGISGKILLCCFWSITACNLCVIILSLFSDIDECTSKTHNCDRNALCKNTEGSFTCTCNRGYKGDGKNCKGIFLALL